MKSSECFIRVNYPLETTLKMAQAILTKMPATILARGSQSISARAGRRWLGTQSDLEVTITSLGASWWQVHFVAISSSQRENEEHVIYFNDMFKVFDHELAGGPVPVLQEPPRRMPFPAVQSPTTDSNPVRVANPQSIFISYRRSDTADLAGRLYDRLVAAYGAHNVFKDVDSLHGGSHFLKAIDDAIGKCSSMLALIGPRWMGLTPGRSLLDSPKDPVRLEIEAGLEEHVRLIPILAQGATMPLETSLPPSLRPIVYLHGLSVRSDPDFHVDVDRLLRHLS